MWFCIEYEPDPDGRKNFRWILIPDLEKGHPVNPDGSRIWSGTQYTRRLSLAEYTGSGSVIGGDFYDLLWKRLAAAQRERIPLLSPYDVSYEKQYREPAPAGKRWVQTYVHHVAHTYKHEKKPDRQVVSVRFYRVIHQYVDPGKFDAGLDPNARELYWPFYYGEFDQDGNMKKECEERLVDMDTGQYRVERRDPFLYWLIPIDYVARHAMGEDLDKADSNLQQAEPGQEKTDKGMEEKP